MKKASMKTLLLFFAIAMLMVSAASAETFVSGDFATGTYPARFGGQGVSGVTNGDTAYILGSAGVYKSTDGLTWSEVTLSGDIPIFGGRPAVTSMDGWIFCMPSGGGVYASENGAKWYEVVAPGSQPYAPRAHGAAATFDGKIWLIGGSSTGSDTANLADVWYSSDGTQWTQATASGAFGVRVWHRAIGFNGKLYVLGGSRDLNDMVPADQVVYTSTDGVDWTNATPAECFSPRGYFGVAEHQGALVVAGGGLYAPWTVVKDTWLTEDGVNWTSSGDALEGAVGFDTMAFSVDRRLVLAGGTADFGSWADIAAPAVAKSFTIPDFDSRTKVYVDVANGFSTATGTSWDQPIGGAGWLDAALNITTATTDGGVILMKSINFGHNRGQFTLEGDHFSNGKTYAIVGGLDPNLSGTDVMFKGNTTMNFIWNGTPNFRFLGAKLYKGGANPTVAPEATNPVLGIYNLNFEYPLRALYLSSRYDNNEGGTGAGWQTRFDVVACSFNNGVEPIWADQFHVDPSTLNFWDCDFTSNTSSNAPPYQGGAAVRINADAVDFNAVGCTFYNNKAYGPGGCVSMNSITGAYSAQHSFTFNDCEITSNATWVPTEASGNDLKTGGGVLSVAGDNVNAKIEFIDSVISKNTTGIRGGGVVRAKLTKDDGCGLWIDGCTVSENGQFGVTASRDNNDFLGGGVFAPWGYVYMTDSVFEGNFTEDNGLWVSGTVVGMRGGGIDVDNCQFLNNTSGGNGGVFGFWNFGNSVDFLTVKNSQFIGNVAGYAGGVVAFAMHLNELPHMKFENNVFAYNQALADTANRGDFTFTIPDGTVFMMFRAAGDPIPGEDYFVDFTNCDFVGNKCPSSVANYINTVSAVVNHEIWSAAIDFRFENTLFASNVMNVSSADGFPGSLWNKMSTSQGDIVDHCYFYNTIDTTGAQVDHWYDTGSYVITPTNCNITDETEPGTAPQVANLVAPTTGATVDGAGFKLEDLRQLAGSPLVDGGTTPVSGLAATDWYGVARSGAYDIGPLEGLEPPANEPPIYIPPAAGVDAGTWSLYR